MFLSTDYDYIDIRRNSVGYSSPLLGCIELTYRCNNNCRHCWVHPPNNTEKELSFEEIKRIVGEARKYGCRIWSISGGEPMLRQDFCDIFDYITRKSTSYYLLTNATLITPKIIPLLKRKGLIIVALYGATADIYDYITRTPGSFEAFMRGVNYLKEAGLNFKIHIIPMKGNFFQLKAMVIFSKKLSRDYSIGISWLRLSAFGDKKINREIISRRLSPKSIVELQRPDFFFYREGEEYSKSIMSLDRNDGLFAHCANIGAFAIDPYGQMTSCFLIKDPSLRYDLRKGNFREAWERFIPSLATKVKITQECQICRLRADCQCCPAYSYLEYRKHGVKVEYLCALAKEKHKFKIRWLKQHRHYYKIADITIQVDSDLPINKNTFHQKFNTFKVEGPGEDNVAIKYHFFMPSEEKDLGRIVYNKPPWRVYKKGLVWVYKQISSFNKKEYVNRIYLFNYNFTRARIYNSEKRFFLEGRLHSLTSFPTDQILLAQLLSNRQGLILHSCGAIFEGKGLLFVGHSEAGKSTVARLLQDKAEILCDDRIIVRDTGKCFTIYGTWSHGDFPLVSANSAPLKVIFFLEKAEDTELIRITSNSDCAKLFISCIIMPFPVTTEWWDRILTLTNRIVEQIPCYVFRFNKDLNCINMLQNL